MEIRNCKNCKKLFNYLQGPQLCPACVEELEKKFAEVKKYVWDNKGANIDQVSEACEVSVKQIKQWIREERLVFSDAALGGITCESCGTPICSGRFCEACKAQLGNTLQSALDKPKMPERKKPERDGNRMRFLDV